jgi:AraC-like DNA-binding protein
MVLYGNMLFSETAKMKSEELPVSTAEENEIPVLSSFLLTEEHIRLYKSSLTHFMETEKPFFDQDLSLQKMARLMDFPSHHLSWFLNQVLELNFRDYINRYRINYFIETYSSNAGQYTTEAMALKAGFKTRSTFYAAFKKETGQTPASYFKNQQADY